MFEFVYISNLKYLCFFTKFEVKSVRWKLLLLGLVLTKKEIINTNR